MTDKKFKVGDKIVRFGKVFEIFKTSKEENIDTGEVEEMIHFKPAYETNANQTLICCIAVSNLDLTNIRRPLTEAEVDKLLDYLKSKIEMKSRFNTRSAKETIKSNEPEKIALILKKLAIVRRDPDTNFTYTKKRLFRRALKRLQEEVALVKGLSLEEAQELILNILQQQTVKSFSLEEDDEDD